MSGPAVLVIDDERAMREGLAKLLAAEGYEVHMAGSGEQALRLLRERPVRVVLTDFRMPGLDGLAVLRHVKEQGIEAEVILLSGQGSIDVAVQALKDGAFDFLTKPPDLPRLFTAVRNAADRRSVLRRAQVLEVEVAQTTGQQRPLIAESAGMQRVLEVVAKVAAADATVLILGESGTGKELIARQIHTRSRRAGQPLVTVNCASIPDTLIESELFGYERGAFTGATRRKPGRFELADGGTLFLDEVGELPPPTQAKLLRALQEGEIERLGGTAPLHVDVRVLAATNKDLARLVHDGRFREDLYYRLDVVTIELPPLRDRPEDVDPLAMHYLKVQARRLGKPLATFSPEALDVLRRYPWPGNVRELQHAVERAVILAQGPTIAAADLGLQARASLAAAKNPAGEDGTLAGMERRVVLEALHRCGGNQSVAARELGIDRSTLYRKLRQFGLPG